MKTRAKIMILLSVGCLLLLMANNDIAKLKKYNHNPYESNPIAYE